MQLYPAIDMKNGQCVRLRQGAFKDITIYSDAPEKVAAHWQEKGASFLHLVDLDGALAGYSVNEEVIRRIADTVSIPIEIGGGIRSKEAVERSHAGPGGPGVLLSEPRQRNAGFSRDMVRTFGEEAIVAGVDAKDGMVAVEGWEKVSSLTASDLCLTMKEYGVRHIVYTDISRDGMLSGPNVEATRKLTEETGLDIIASGGVSCMEDLKCLHEAGIRGAIIGKALYENRIDLAEAVRLYEA
ncbi:MAG: 1-(5-phosphoribosyl)-5-[(5-phosphoribosylamino)methylideneamino]imidazole-4-carboxamide isomerase [Enterocloster bolteae]